MVAAPGGLTALGPAPAPPLPLEGDPAAALGSAEWAVREAATAALRAQGTEARPRLTAAAADPDPEVAARAGALLSDLDRRERQVVWAPRIRPEWAEAIPDLLARITHEHPEVRLEALGAVTALDDPAALDLTRELLTDPDPRVALVAAATLLERGDRAGIEVIRAAALKGPVQDRIRAVALLSKHGEGEDAAVLGEACGDDDARVRALAARGALAQGKEALLGRVAPLLHDEDERVRLAVIGALQHVSAEAATPLLAEAVRDPNDAIRAAAVATLTGIASGDAYGALGLALGDSIRETARAAAAALYHVVQTRDALMIPPEGLEAGAGHDDPAIRNYVAQITLRFVDEGGVVSAATLAKFVGDEEPGIRSYSIGGKSWGQLLLEQAKQVPLVAADVEALGSSPWPSRPTRGSRPTRSSPGRSPDRGAGRSSPRGSPTPTPRSAPTAPSGCWVSPGCSTPARREPRSRWPWVLSARRRARRRARCWTARRSRRSSPPCSLCSRPARRRFGRRRASASSAWPGAR